jgi:hypothetical protein
MDFLIIDTCFWSHVKELFDSEKIDLRPVILQFNWEITEAIKKEIKNLKVDKFAPIIDAHIFPISNSELDHLLQKYPTVDHFDVADQTIILIGMREKPIISTDDGELLLECQALDLQAFRLPIFMLNLVRAGIIEKKVINSAIRYWIKSGSYKVTQLNQLKKELQKL